MGHFRKSTDISNFMWPAAYSLCIHLLLLALLNSEWKRQQGLAWLSSALFIELEDIADPRDQLSQVKEFVLRQPDEQQLPPDSEPATDSPPVSASPETPAPSDAEMLEQAPAEVKKKASGKTPPVRTIHKPAIAKRTTQPAHLSKSAAAVRLPDPKPEPATAFSSMSSLLRAGQQSPAPSKPFTAYLPVSALAEKAGPSHPQVPNQAPAQVAKEASKESPPAKKPPIPATAPRQAALPVRLAKTAATGNFAELKPRPQVASASKPASRVREQIGKRIAQPAQAAMAAPSTVAAKPNVSVASTSIPPINGKRGSDAAVRKEGGAVSGIGETKATHPHPVLSPPEARSSEKPATSLSELPKGIIQAVVDGDLVLKISGKEVANGGVRVYILFHDYPKSKHKRAMTLAESKKSIKVAPKIVTTSKDTLQAVLEIAADGIYDFRAVSQSENTLDAPCLITFNGVGQKNKVRSLGTRKIGSDISIVKILMPEGILWEDHVALNGSIEDSESITKYNSDTGLVWKEYKK